MKFPLYTSINPKMERSAQGEDVSQEYQRQCLETWISAGFEIISLNNEEEQAEITATYPEVKPKLISETKPRIIDFIQAALEDRQPSVGFINSDCLYIGDASMADSLKNIAKTGVLLAERLNIDSMTFEISERCFGFDAFFFPTCLLPSLGMDQSLRIGDAWWDYIFPLCLLDAGGQLFKTSPLMLHLSHELRWSDANNLSGALIGRTMFSEKLGFPTFEKTDPQTIDDYGLWFFNFIKEKAQYANLRGTTLTGKMVDRIPLELIRHIDVRFDRDKAVSDAVEAYRMSRPSNKIIGETLCSVSRGLRTIGLGGNLADCLFTLGDDLQYAARLKTKG